MPGLARKRGSPGLGKRRFRLGGGGAVAHSARPRSRPPALHWGSLASRMGGSDVPMNRGAGGRTQGGHGGCGHCGAESVTGPSPGECGSRRRVSEEPRGGGEALRTLAAGTGPSIYPQRRGNRYRSRPWCEHSSVPAGDSCQGQRWRPRPR